MISYSPPIKSCSLLASVSGGVYTFEACSNESSSTAINFTSGHGSSIKLAPWDSNLSWLIICFYESRSYGY